MEIALRQISTSMLHQYIILLQYHYLASTIILALIEHTQKYNDSLAYTTNKVIKQSSFPVCIMFLFLHITFSWHLEKELWPGFSSFFIKLTTS